MFSVSVLTCYTAYLVWSSFHRRNLLRRPINFFWFLELTTHSVMCLLPMPFSFHKYLVFGSIVVFLIIPYDISFTLPKFAVTIPSSYVPGPEDQPRVSILFSSHFHFNWLLTGIYMVCPPWAWDCSLFYNGRLESLCLSAVFLRGSGSLRISLPSWGVVSLWCLSLL